MSALEIPSRTFHPSSPAPLSRASYEEVHPHPTPLSPVAQSIEQKNSAAALTDAQVQRDEAEMQAEDAHHNQERPSFNRARNSWRSGRPPSWVTGNEDRRGYSAVGAQDYGVPGSSAPGRTSVAQDHPEPPYDPRTQYYDQPYYSHPHHGPPPFRHSPPRASWRSSATVAVPPPGGRHSRQFSRASQRPAQPKVQDDDAESVANESDHEEEASQPRPQKQKQRPLTWGSYRGTIPGLQGYHGYQGYPGYEGTPPPQEVIMRLPFTYWMNSGIKDHFVATLAEFVGTVMFLFFAFAGTQVANINADNPDEAAASTTGASTGFSPIVLTYIALSFGFSLMVNVWIFYRISGGLFNPAVTLGMVMVKSLSYTRGFLLLGAQLVGSIITSLIVKVLFPVDFNVRTTLSPGTSVVQGVFIEGLLTAELVFAIFMLAKEKHRATYLAPIGIGIALFIAELVGVYYTGGSLNPARSFGPCVVTGIWDKEHWIYWVGPACGAIGAVGFYNFIKMLEYEMANPGQDAHSEGKAEREARALKEKKDDDNTASQMA